MTRKAVENVSQICSFQQTHVWQLQLLLPSFTHWSESIHPVHLWNFPAIASSLESRPLYKVHYKVMVPLQISLEGLGQTKMNRIYGGDILTAGDLRAATF